MTDEANNEFSVAMEQSKWRFESQGLRASDRAYEYGVMVVKNAMLVSGGGLFFIPTMAGLSANISIEWAFYSGMFYGLCVLLTLIANYLIHLNWLFLESSWEEIYEIEKIQLRMAYSRAFSTDEKMLEDRSSSLKKINKRVMILFYAPHVCAGIFVLIFGLASFCLYEAFFSVVVKI